MDNLKKGVIVVCKKMPNGPRGTIIRKAKDGSWCDVEWVGKISKTLPFACWSKRMRTEALVYAEPQKEVEK